MSAVPITHAIDIYHLTRTGDKESYPSTPALTAIPATIFPAGNDIVALYPGEFSYQLYQLFLFPPRDIKNGDKVTTGSETFIVRGVPQDFKTSRQQIQQIVIEKVVGT